MTTCILCGKKLLIGSLSVTEYKGYKVHVRCYELYNKLLLELSYYNTAKLLKEVIAVNTLNILSEQRIGRVK